MKIDESSRLNPEAPNTEVSDRRGLDGKQSGQKKKKEGPQNLGGKNVRMNISQIEQKKEFKNKE